MPVVWRCRVTSVERLIWRLGRLVLVNELDEEDEVAIRAALDVVAAAKTYRDAENLDAEHKNLRTVMCMHRHQHELTQALAAFEAAVEGATT